VIDPNRFSLRRLNRGTASRAGSGPSVTGAAVGVLVALRGPRLKRIFGVFERLFYVSSLAWFLIVSIELAHIGHELLRRPVASPPGQRWQPKTTWS
jgi:hypothetical protein